MKSTNFLKRLAIGLACTCVVATGCKKPNYITPIPGRSVGLTDTRPTGPMTPDRGGSLPGPSGITTTPFPPGGDTGFPLGTNHIDWIKDGGEKFKSDTVFFAFDSSAIKTSEKSKVENVAAYLKSNPAHAVEIEGHCDERGTEEYNRSLGERRALAVREQLIGLGISPERVDTITFGKDRPADTGHNEAAWQKNRRGVFILLTPPK